MTHVHSINAPTNVPTFTDEPEVASDMQEKCKTLTIEELRKKFDTGGLSGLVNMGNTCYMNAALQCLSATIEFVEYFRGTGHGNGEYKKDLKQGTTRILFEERKKRKRETPDKITDDITDDILLEIRARFRKSLTYRLRNLLVVMWGINCRVQPKTFKNGLEKLQREDFRGFSQEDSPLCLLLILDQIHEETKTDTGIFGINIHKAGQDSQWVENWSEGCQVFKKSADFEEFMKICRKAKEIHGNSFTYTLIESSDIK